MEQFSTLTLCFFSGFAWTALALLPFVFGCTKNASPKASKGAPKNPAVLNAAQIKPQVIPKNAKEELIAKGELKKGKHDYPTMDDVVSDWDSEKDAKGEKGKGKSAEKADKKGDAKGKGKKKSVEKVVKKKSSVKKEEVDKKEEPEDSKTPPKDKKADEKEDKEADDADKQDDKKEETSKK